MNMQKAYEMFINNLFDVLAHQWMTKEQQYLNYVGLNYAHNIHYTLFKQPLRQHWYYDSGRNWNSLMLGIDPINIHTVSSLYIVYQMLLYWFAVFLISQTGIFGRFSQYQFSRREPFIYRRAGGGGAAPRFGVVMSLKRRMAAQRCKNPQVFKSHKIYLLCDVRTYENHAWWKKQDSPDPKLAMPGEPLFRKPLAHEVQIGTIHSSVQSLSIRRSMHRRFCAVTIKLGRKENTVTHPLLSKTSQQDQP